MFCTAIEKFLTYYSLLITYYLLLKKMTLSQDRSKQVVIEDDYASRILTVRTGLRYRDD